MIAFHRAAFVAGAAACMGEESARPKRDEFSLALDENVLQFFWKDGSKSAKSPLRGALRRA
jgi:hypothetical protein